jgi:hypothetical protein
MPRKQRADLPDLLRIGQGTMEELRNAGLQSRRRSISDISGWLL